MNRFASCKNLKDLYVAFEEGVLEYNVLTNEELDRLASVFEANLPEKVDMPDRPLTEAGYTLIWNVTVDIVENEYKKEEKEMKKEIATTKEEEVTAGEKAKAFAEASKERLSEGFKFVVEHVDVAKEEVKKMADMNEKQLETYLKEQGKSVLDRIIEAVEKFSNKSKEDAKQFPRFESAFKYTSDTADNVVTLIKRVLDEDNLSGWGKFKAIVKELVKWLLRLLLKVGAIVLKIAFTLTVGAIKIGAIALTTIGKTASVVNKEVVKPSVKAGKKAWTDHKAKKAIFDEIEDELFDEFEDEEKDVIDIEAVIADEE